MGVTRKAEDAPKALAVGMTVTGEIARRYNEMAALLDQWPPAAGLARIADDMDAYADDPAHMMLLAESIRAMMRARRKPDETGQLPRWLVSYRWANDENSQVVEAPSAVQAAWDVGGSWKEGMEPELISVEPAPADAELGMGWLQ